MKPRPPLPSGPFLIVGLARSGVAAARTLRVRGEQVTGVDQATPPGAEELRELGVELACGEDGLDRLQGVRTVVKSPGVPADAPVIRLARERGIAVLGELELAWRLLPNEFIAVTATNGKTTTVEWIGHIHREAARPVAVAGNVGVALSGLVGELDADVTVVCEASSFQLEDALEFAPEAAVLLNLSPDHLDRHGTMAAYRAAKLRMFEAQGQGDLAVIPYEARAWELGGEAARVCFGEPDGPGDPASGAEMIHRDDALWWRGERFFEIEELRLRGAHNVQNAMAAAAVCLARGIDPDAVLAGLRSFTGVAHRLQEVGHRGGVLYVNDSKATNVASTRVALSALALEQPAVHLILGGQGKGQDFSTLRDPIVRDCRAVYVIGEDAPRIAADLQGIDFGVHLCGDLEVAVAAAAAAASPGEIVLLSPGCASFDQFSDFEARGRRFQELVGGLRDS